MKKKTSFSSVCEKTNKNGLEVFVARSRVLLLGGPILRAAPDPIALRSTERSLRCYGYLGDASVPVDACMA